MQTASCSSPVEVPRTLASVSVELPRQRRHWATRASCCRRDRPKKRALVSFQPLWSLLEGCAVLS